MSIQFSAVLARSPNIVASDFSGQLVMMNIESGKYYGLDDVGAAIWRLTETPRSADEVIQALTAGIT